MSTTHFPWGIVLYLYVEIASYHFTAQQIKNQEEKNTLYRTVKIE